ncbi:hypothetical protein QE364_002768 [Nocardioides zeae]|uniref:Uncharacterized protein n=1 Tax=Nocardioides zeae TaxID=1457234 RepID=A0ACC6IK24_9ACTN|nr:BLUF domain-containing protein [Nocardioides zeae]MDR6173643.1 hypothetical protein [Nocardioides zeae]MDR6211049.1 hypothetical protein [Nocardioides zeae]
MISLTYLSSAIEPMSPDELEDLLTQSRAANHDAGLTGALLYADGSFVQTLEGPDEAVHATFGRILADNRHRGLFIVLNEQIAERAFPEWTMGFRRIDGVEAQRLPGFSDYLRTNREMGLATPAGRGAEVFHQVFREGLR